MCGAILSPQLVGRWYAIRSTKRANVRQHTVSVPCGFGMLQAASCYSWSFAVVIVCSCNHHIHPSNWLSVCLSVDQSIIIINVLHWCVIVLSIGVTKSLDASLGCWMRMLRRYSRSRCCYPCWISFMRLATLWLRGLCFRLTLVRYGSCSFYMCVSVCSMLL